MAHAHFVGYGYNDRHRWTEGQLFPSIITAGDEVKTGENLQVTKLPIVFAIRLSLLVC